MMSVDAWGRLWEKATGEADTPATIEVDAEDCGQVTIVWPDGSRAGLVFDNGDWRHVGSLDTAPCDVAARDSF